jgi:hypothetical protein
MVEAPCAMRLAVAMPMFYVSFRSPDKEVVEAQPAEFDNRIHALSRVTACVRETVANLPDDDLIVLTLACDICDEHGELLDTVQFTDVVSFH